MQTSIAEILKQNPKAWSEYIKPFNDAWGAYLRVLEEFKRQESNIVWRLTKIRFSKGGYEEQRVLVYCFDVLGMPVVAPVAFHHPTEPSIGNTSNWFWNCPIQNFTTQYGKKCEYIMGNESFANGQNKIGGHVVFIADGFPTDVVCGLGWDGQGAAHRSPVLHFQQFDISQSPEIPKNCSSLENRLSAIELRLYVLEQKKRGKNDPSILPNTGF